MNVPVMPNRVTIMKIRKGRLYSCRKNITLYASQRAVVVKMQGDRIASVTIQHIETGEQTELTAPL